MPGPKQRRGCLVPSEEGKQSACVEGEVGVTGQDGAQRAALTPTFLQHWIANNLFGLAFSLNGVELLHLNNVSTGCILLGGLFIYDIFWVSQAGT